MIVASLGCAAAPALRAEHSPARPPSVVLLHGLARTATSMQRMEAALQDAGYHVCNIEYPSREHSIADLASKYVVPGIARCIPDRSSPINFVTHSLGGIVVRELANSGAVRNFGRVVMLGPPNHGSEVVDALSDWYLFDAINGPAGNELGVLADSVPQALGPVKFETGIIAGSNSINWINSLIIPGEDDGKVSVESAKLQGMRDFVVLPVSHPFLMKDDEAIKQTIHFLRNGNFAHDGSSQPSGAQ
jgi:pimeloyl-ACP methyl ester carboxylesterase